MGFPVQVIVPYWLMNGAANYKELFLHRWRGVEECEVVLEVGNKGQKGRKEVQTIRI